MKLTLQLIDGAGSFDFEGEDSDAVLDAAFQFVADKGVRAVFEFEGNTFTAMIEEGGLRVTLAAKSDVPRHPSGQS